MLKGWHRCGAQRPWDGRFWVAVSCKNHPLEKGLPARLIYAFALGPEIQGRLMAKAWLPGVRWLWIQIMTLPIINWKCKVFVAQLYPTLCNPNDCSLPGSVHGIRQARTLEWVAISFSRRFFLTQGLNPGLLHCRQILYHLSYREAINCATISMSVMVAIAFPAL